MNNMPANFSICALCKLPSVLQDSHIIPNAYFRAMKRNNNGKLVRFDDRIGTKASETIKTWSQHLLCIDCERRLGKWETQWIKSLRTASNRFEHGEATVSIAPFDYNTLRCFLLSVLWKASVCTLPEFAAAKLSTDLNEVLRLHLLAGRAPDDSVCATAIRKMIDPRNVLTARRFEDVAFSPSRISIGSLRGFRFLFAGYVVEYVTSKVSRRTRRMSGFISDVQVLQIPSVAMQKVPEMMYMGRTAHAKNRMGLTTVPSKSVVRLPPNKTTTREAGA